MTEVSVYHLVRPFAWIAAIAFSLGFTGYIALEDGAGPPDTPAMAAAVAGQSG